MRWLLDSVFSVPCLESSPATAWYSAHDLAAGRHWTFNQVTLAKCDTDNWNMHHSNLDDLMAQRTYLHIFGRFFRPICQCHLSRKGGERFNMQPSDTISLDTRHSSHLFLLLSKICSGSRLLHGMLKFWHNWNICDNDKPRNIIRAGLQDFTMKFIEWRVHIILGHRTGRLFPVCIKPQPHNYTWTQFTRVA